MSLALSFRKIFIVNLKFLALIVVAFPVLIQAQNKHTINHIQPINYLAAGGNFRTTAATCATGPVVLTGTDTLTGNTIANGHVFECDKAPFIIAAVGTATNITSPCIATEYTNFHNNLATNGSETFYEGGTDIACLGPAGCAFPIGDPFGPNPGVPGNPWGVTLGYLDPNLQHDFVFCRQGNITTTTVTLTDCWTGSVIASTPTTPVNFSNTNPPNTATCFTLTIPAGTDIGKALYAISPPTASAAFTQDSTGQALVDPSALATGTYVVTYSFTPSVSSGCGMITGTYSFSITPPTTVTVNSPTVCPGTTATLTANAGSGTPTYAYSWTPSTGLSATTGSVVTVNNPTVTTTYTVTATDNKGCTATDTAVVTVTTFTVNKATICSGDSAMLIASNSAFSYTWSPATGLNTTTNDTVKASPPSGIQVYTVTGTNAACPSLTVTLTDSVIVKLSPTISVFSPTVCSSTTATITATGATSYTWSPLTNLTSSVTKDTVYISNPTTNLTYTAYGTAANGCKDSAVSTVVVSNHLGIVSGTPVIRCYGTPFGLNAVGASTYTWTSNDPANLDFGHDTTWTVQTSVANASATAYTVVITGTSLSGLSVCTGTDTVIVTINPTPTVTASNPLTAICSGTSTTLTANASGPAVTSYNWSPSNGLSVPTPTISSAVASPTVTTVYTATGTDAFGCSSSASFTVNVIPVPSFTVNSPPACFGYRDSLTVIPTTSVSGAQSYSWTPASGLTATVGPGVATTPTASGVYTYSVIGTNTISTSSVACTYTAVSFVTAIPLPTVSIAPPAPICAGSTATLTASSTGTVTVSSYSWNPATNPTQGAVVNANPLTTTIYTVTGTSAAGCSAQATTTLTVNGVPTFSISNSNPVYCKGDSSTLVIVPTSTAAATYIWVASVLNNTTTVTTVKPTTTTVYTVNATATVGSCPATSQATVTVHQLPTLTAPTNTTICNGGSTPLTTSNNLQVYTWSPLAALSGSTNTATVTATPTITTTYTVTGQDAFGCHADTVTTIVTVTTPTVAPSSNSPVCKGKTINLTANTNGTTYTWSATNGYTSIAQNPIISNATFTNTAVYTVTVTLGNCTVTNTVAVIVDSPTVTVSPTTTICPGQTTTLTASGANTYTWSPVIFISGSTNADVVTANPTSNTVYTVTGTDAANCPETKTVIVSVDSIVANMVASPETGNAPLNVVFTNLSVNASNYVWDYGNGSNQTTTSLTDSTKTIYPAVGTYTVTLVATGTAGNLTCTNQQTLVIVVTENYSIIIPNIFTPNGDGVNDNFMVKGEGISTFSMEIFDRWGLKMFSTTSVTGEWDGKTAGGKEVSADTYFYIINATSSKTGESQSYKGYLSLIR